MIQMIFSQIQQAPGPDFRKVGKCIIQAIGSQNLGRLNRRLSEVLLTGDRSKDLEEHPTLLSTFCQDKKNTILREC